jgi:hypothetical protein
VAAARLVHGECWQSWLAVSFGLSQQLLGMIASGDRALTPASTAAIVKAVREDAGLRIKQAERALTLLKGIE